MARLPSPSTKAYILPGDGPVVVLFHGFTGSPYDLKPLALSLQKHGCEVRVPLLLGHGTKSIDLEGITSDAWLQQAQFELDNVDKKRQLVIGGLSMGALIAILLAKENNAKALILLSPALFLSLSAELMIAGIKLGILPTQSSVPKFGGHSDIADPLARKKCPSYSEMPFFGLLQFDALRLKAKIELSHITMPSFVAFGQLDSAINIKSSRQCVLDLARGYIFSKVYARSKHVISLDYDRDFLSQDLWHFLTTHLRS